MFWLMLEVPALGADPAFLAAPSSVGLGKPFLVRLTAEAPLSGVRVTWMGKTMETPVSTWNGKGVALALLGTDVLDAKTGQQTLEVSGLVNGTPRTFRRTVRVHAVDYPRQDLTLPKEMVTPPKEVNDRINEEYRRTSRAKNTTTPARNWVLPLQRPVDGVILSSYGLRRFLNNKPRNPHRGLDFRSAMGNPVLACAAGTVVLVGDHYFAGNSVYVDHGNGVVSMYFHLSRPMVAEGDTVERGQVVGLTGMTGRATGPHLHFSLSVQGRLVDPEPLFDEQARDALLR